MILRIPPMLLALSLLAACGKDEPAKPQEKSFGAQLGDSYKGLLDKAQQGAGDLDHNMQRTEQAVRDRGR